MYIAPNSTIKLLTGVPIDKNQSDTLWFSSVANQTAYFNTKVKRTFTLQTYQRLQRGYCRLEVPADQIYDCNYMMFQNTSYGNKWFYAFVNNVEYINDDTSEVRFMIDPIQTWFFDYTLNQVYVERITPAHDDIGENILPEPLTMGEYVLNGSYHVIGEGVSNPLDFSDMCVIIQFVNPAGSSGQGGSNYSEGNFYDGVYSAAQLKAYGTDQRTAINQFISDQAAAFDAIVGMYMCPLKSIGGSVPSDHNIAPSTSPRSWNPTEPAITKQTRLDGYLPRNAKCYTYPYTYFMASGADTQTLTLRYEFFENLTPAFFATSNLTYPVEICLFPMNYKNQETTGIGTELEYRLEKLSMKGFPQCSWSMDAYNAWLAQNSVPMAINGLSALGQGIVSGMAGGGGAGGIAGGIAGTVGAIADFASSYYTTSIAADITKGSFATGSNDTASERWQFKGGCVTQPYNFIKSIDQFFDAFGYAKREWMTVNIHQRSRWTYIKTNGANVDGNVPADDAQYIADCYDRGIRFWADTAHPCDYGYAANGFLS